MEVLKVVNPANQQAEYASVSNPVPVALPSSGASTSEVLAQPLVARQLAAGASSANTALTSTCRRITIHARDANIRFMIGSTSQTANASTSHWIAQGERLDYAVPATPNIAVIRAGSIDGVLEVTELS